MRIFGVDVSHWQDHIDWPKFYAGGVRFATVKCSQGDYLLDNMRADHLKGAHDTGMATGAYPWIDPLMTPDANGNKALEAIKNLPVSYITPDMEQWWADWVAYGKWNKDPQHNPVPPSFNKTKLSNHSKLMIQWFEKNFSGPTITYSRTSFIKVYMPEFAPFLANRKMYVAQYPRVFPKGTKTTWENLPNYMPPPAWKPVLPDPTTDGRMIQWSGDTFIVPGYNRVIDMDYFDGTEEEMKQFLGVAATPPMEPTHEEKVEILWKEYLKIHI